MPRRTSEISSACSTAQDQRIDAHGIVHVFRIGHLDDPPSSPNTETPACHSIHPRSRPHITSRLMSPLQSIHRSHSHARALKFNKAGCERGRRHAPSVSPPDARPQARATAVRLPVRRARVAAKAGGAYKAPAAVRRAARKVGTFDRRRACQSARVAARRAGV